LGRIANSVRLLQSRLWCWEAELRGAELRGRVVFLGRPVLTMAPRSVMIFGGENEIFSSVRCNDLGNIQPAILRTLAPQARLELSRGVGVSGASICAAWSITIGEGTLVGTGAMIFDNDLHRPVGEFSMEDAARETAKPISIGRGCFIGARAIILKGVTIGDRCAVAAGAVVTRDVPAGMVAFGNPATTKPWKAAEATKRKIATG
jgi:carbonic anhydrase/acetyltransferase-like protein (isoleucine patch superfamily)